MTKPSSRGSRSRRKGGVPRSLTQSQIVEAALELTRVNGLDGLTMNALATRLGVGVMTIYSYYRGRDELLDAMADRAAAELYDNHRDSIDQPWDVELRAHYRALRESLRSHPSLADLIFFRGQVLAANADQLDRIAEHMHRHIASMIHGGIEPTLAMRVFLGLSFFTLASALRDEDNIAPTALPDRLQAMLGETMDARQILSDARFGSDAEFETLLDLLLLGLKSTVDDNGTAT